MVIDDALIDTDAPSSPGEPEEAGDEAGPPGQTWPTHGPHHQGLDARQRGLQVRGGACGRDGWGYRRGRGLQVWA